MLKIAALIAIAFYGVYIIVQKAFQEYDWGEYTMTDREYNELERKDQEKEEDSKNRF